MTTVDEDVAADAARPDADPAPLLPSASGAPDRPRLMRRAVVLTGASVLVAIAAGVVIVASAFHGVTLTYDAEPITCTGTEVVTAAMGGSLDAEDFRSHVVEVAHGARCELRVHVVNRGWAEVTVDAITLRMLAPGNAADLEVPFLNPNGRTGAIVDNLDYRFDLEGPLPVAPGSAQTFTVPLVYGGNAANSRCTAVAWDIPLASVSAFGQERTLAPPADSAFWFLYGTTEECDLEF